MVRDIGLIMTHLEKAMESEDIPQILAAVEDLKKSLVFNESSSRKEVTFPTELTALLLQRFGGKSSVWMGRNLRILQMKMLNMEVDSHRFSDEFTNLTLAMTIVSTIVLSLVAFC